MVKEEVDIKALKTIINLLRDKIDLIEVIDYDYGVKDLTYYQIDKIDMWNDKIKIIIKEKENEQLV